MKNVTRLIAFVMVLLLCRVVAAGPNDFEVKLADTAGESAFELQDNLGVPVVRMRSDGLVGIGTVTPASELHVVGVVTSDGLAVDTNVLFVDSVNGRVGIGTTQPSIKFHVNGQLRSSSFSSSGNGTVGLPSYRFLSDSNVGMFHPSSDNLAFTTGGVERIRIDNVGNVGIGISTPAVALDVAGDINASGAVTQGSSRAFKKEISYITDQEAVEALSGLTHVRFQYRDDAHGEERLGFIAEDVPEIVASRDRRHLNPMDLTAIFAKVLQRQQRTLADLYEVVAKLERSVQMMNVAR